jgi:hypothetical protein
VEEKMNMEEVKAMLCADNIVWNALVCLLEKHPSGNLHGTGSLPWTSRDVYAHFTRWFNRNNASIKAWCAGKELPQLPKSPEEMNDIWQQEDSALTLADARTQAMDAFARRMSIIENIPLAKWDAELEKLVRYDGATHYAMHINYIVAGK